MRPLGLTVIVPTFNRAASLRSAVDALLHQDADPRSYEVLVVDNNSSDGTTALLASIADARLRSVREGRQGLAFARNAGLAAARGEHVAFIDDDVEAEPNWVSCILAAFAARPDVDGLGGQVLPDWAAPPPGWLTRRHWGPLALQDHGSAERVFSADCPIGLVGANLAFRRGVFGRIGVFSPEVQRVGNGIGSTEDHELLARLYDAGGRMLYLPDMRVVARVQPERCERAYHRRWHAGHGSFHAQMRRPDMERSRASVCGVPAHLFRSAARDTARLIVHGVQGHLDQAFEAELRLRFFLGFARSRMTRQHSRTPQAAAEWAQ